MQKSLKAGYKREGAVAILGNCCLEVSDISHLPADRDNVPCHIFLGTDVWSELEPV